MRNLIKNTTLVSALAMTAFAAAQDVRVAVNGDPVRFTGAQPRSVNGRVLVPLRGVFENLGAYVNWNPAARQVHAIQGNQDVRLTIGSREAMVNGREVTLDVPAQIVNGSTLVPLRFLSESLGANVDWNAGQQMVMISTRNGDRAERFGDRRGNGNNAWNGRDDWNGRDNEGRRNNRPDRFNDRRNDRRDAVAVLSENTVIPVKLDTPLNSNTAREGDRFTTTIADNNGGYSSIPQGTKIEGHVTQATAQTGDNPGILELSFDRMVFPGGRSIDLSGTLVDMKSPDVKRDESGRLVATGKAQNNRGAYAGYGAGAGLIVGALTKKPLEGTLIGGLLGYAIGASEKAKKNPTNVDLNSGMEMGVRLTNDVTIYSNDVR